MAIRAIREARFRTGTAFNTTYQTASSAYWNTSNSTKLRLTAFDDSGLTHEVVPDPTLETRRYANRAPVPTIRRGSFAHSTYLGAANATNTTNAVAALLEVAMGGVQDPSERTDAADSSGVHTTSRIYAAGIENKVSVGQGLLVGTRGDGRGNAEFRRVVATGTDYADVHMQWQTAPNDGDAIVISTTCYLDPDATQKYIDWLLLGHATNDQRQIVGSVCESFELQGGGVGELPQISWTWRAADWQWTTGASLATTTAPQGNAPPVDRGLGGLFLSDAYAGSPLSRTVLKGYGISMPSFISLLDQPSYNGINGVAGAEKGVAMPVLNFGLLFDEDMSGLYDDLNAGTAKGLAVQFGHAAQACAVLDIQRGFVQGSPTPPSDGAGGLSSVDVSIGADEGDQDTSTDLARSAFSVHFF